MDKKIGFIGCGNMGSSMVGGLINSRSFEPKNIFVSTKTENSASNMKDKFNINASINNKDVVKNSNIIILSVKPYMFKDVINEIKDYLTEDKLIISVAAGITIENLEDLISKKHKIIRSMPNTPALVGEAMSAICPNANVSKEDIEVCKKVFESFGECVEISEKDFHAFIALCGSSPAYIFMFIEAMADGAVKLGIPRNKAYKMAAQSILGSAKMVLDTRKHPGELKDAVCSPGGTTIDAVVELEKLGFRSSVIQAMDKCAEKSKNM
ncbi:MULTISPECIES: pyrroline-5-carboxylate reductase [unclassified Clostridium]|uniref:pyrroline-5-carboxylate reductase n=1 Tax=unclassified Clostridium TaxID=2614128 RepID=UPI0013FAB093|nr:MULTISPECIES: pyrroline-5-carboxylate reductase [unclassified Clostridium]NFR86148.1 pyrroline-5-carboxylate reductase [Clostridium botulinum]NFR91263.1 pyrroline-5-carboxylate reductase [Clostridium botulinum]NFT99189.1 pyrroline-5-carboxylate reductase [Clostridium botulinum]